MTQLVGWLASHGAGLSIVGAAVAFMVSTTQQIIQRRSDARERAFQAFHKLVKDLVSPDPTDGKAWIDRQAAVVFELRHFPLYYEFTERMLIGLREKWVADLNFQWPRLIEEIDLTLKHIEQNK
jgi:hypothetical protein